MIEEIQIDFEFDLGSPSAIKETAEKLNEVIKAINKLNESPLNKPFS